MGVGEVRVLHDFAADAASAIAVEVGAGPLVVTGGGAAKELYGSLSGAGLDRSIHILFSDERSVPPDDPASNFRMVAERLLEPAGLTNVHRIKGEIDPGSAAREYEAEIADLLDAATVQILGMGEDCHIAALFPGSPQLEADGLVTPVDRPDGMLGVSLTPPALQLPDLTFVIVTGPEKAAAVKRAVESGDPASECPVHLLESPVFLLDEAAASTLSR